MASLSIVLAAALALLPLGRGLAAADNDRSQSLATVQNVGTDASLAPTAFDGSSRFGGNLVYAGEGGKFRVTARAEAKGSPQTTPRPKPKGATEPPSPGPGGAQPAPPKADDSGGAKKAEGGGDKKGGGLGLDNPAVGAGIGLLAGAAIGFLVGGPIGACVGACVGALIGALVSNMIKARKGGDGGGEKK